MNMKSFMTLITRNSDSRLEAARREPVLIPGMMLLAFAILFSQFLSASVNGSSWEEIEALRKNHLYSPQKKQQLYDWLKSEGIEDINAFIKKAPTITGLSVEKTLKPRMEYLRSLHFQDLRTFVSKVPKVLCMHPEDNLKPKLEWLQNHGIKDVIAFIERYPPLIGLSLDENIIPKWTEYTTHWRFTSEELEDTPFILGAKLSRVIATRVFIDRLAQLAHQPHFDFSKLSLDRRKLLIINLNPQLLFNNLVETNIIREGLNSLEELNTAEITAIAHLIQTGFISKILTTPSRIGPHTFLEINRLCQASLKEKKL